MPQPQVVAEETVLAPANGGTRQRSADECSQPAQLARPLEESARLIETASRTRVLNGVTYNYTALNGWRKA